MEHHIVPDRKSPSGIIYNRILRYQILDDVHIIIPAEELAVHIRDNTGGRGGQQGLGVHGLGVGGQTDGQGAVFHSLCSASGARGLRAALRGRTAGGQQDGQCHSASQEH